MAWLWRAFWEVLGGRSRSCLLGDVCVWRRFSSAFPARVLSMLMNDSTSGMQAIIPYQRHSMGLGFLLLQHFPVTPSVTAARGSVELGGRDRIEPGSGSDMRKLGLCG